MSRATWWGVVLSIALCSGCATLGEPVTENLDPDDPQGKPGLFTGAQGEWVIFERGQKQN